MNNLYLLDISSYKKMVRLTVTYFNFWKPYVFPTCSLIERSVFDCPNVTCLKYGICYKKMCDKIQLGIIEGEEKRYFEKIKKESETIQNRSYRNLNIFTKKH